MAESSRMLAVDDDKDLLQSIYSQFAAEGFEVDTALDGDIALQLLEDHTYDIVLLDLKMPRMDGLTVLEEMKKLKKFPNVIVLTAVHDIPTALECLRIGAKDYITKPYDPEELLQIIRRVLI